MIKKEEKKNKNRTSFQDPFSILSAECHSTKDFSEKKKTIILKLAKEKKSDFGMSYLCYSNKKAYI